MARIRSSEITPKQVYLNRRAFMQTSAIGIAGAAAVGATFRWPGSAAAQGLRKFEGVRKSPLSATEAPNSYQHITSFNNFYEFDSGAGDGPKKLSGRFRPSPWGMGNPSGPEIFICFRAILRYPFKGSFGPPLCSKLKTKFRSKK